MFSKTLKFVLISFPSVSLALSVTNISIIVMTLYVILYRSQLLCQYNNDREEVLCYTRLVMGMGK